MKKIHIAKSNIAGRGIFASEDIKKGDFIVQMNGRLVHKIFRTARDLTVGKTWVPIRKHWWISPEFPVKYMNHSCEANAGFKTPKRLYAMQDIQKGQEITIDYATLEYVDFWTSPCNCGSKKCRKQMYSIQFLPEKVYKSYLPYIPRFLQKIRLQYRHGARKIA